MHHASKQSNKILPKPVGLGSTYDYVCLCAWLSLETVFFILLSITLAFDRCRHTENTDLQYVLNVDAFSFPSSSLDSCDSFFK